MEDFGKFMTTILLLIGGILMQGFILMKLWAWILVPTLNIPSLSIVGAMGIWTVITFIRPTSSKKSKDIDWEWVAKSIFTPWFIFLIGYIIHLFI